MLARELFVAFVDLQVLVQVGLLSELLFAAFVVTGVRTLLGVYTKVVKEVVPLVENFAAVLSCTVQKLLRLLVSYTKEFIYVEVICVRDMLLDADLL